MRRSIAPLAAVAALLATTPARGAYRPDADHLDWYLVISDTHIGASGETAAENLAWATNEAYAAVQPTMVVNCGDLTDATGGGWIPTGPHDEEWQEYQQIVDDAGMTYDVYVDLPGNHDQYGDKDLPHYRKYSVAGRADGQTQHSLRRDGPAGKVHLLTAATPANNGGGVLQDDAALDPGEMAFLSQAMADNADADVHLAFGHHPLDTDVGNAVGEGKQEFYALLKQYDAQAYVYGHTHSYDAEYRDGTLHLNVDSLGKSDANNVAILALDGGTLSARAFDVATWPFVVVTAPVDADLGGGNPRAYSVPPDWPTCPVRALVFGDRPPDGVRFQVDGGPWQDMAEAHPHVWAATFDSTGLGPGRHALRVQASPWNRNDHQIEFRVGATACSNGQDDDFDGLADWPDDPGCAWPGDDDEKDPPTPPPDDLGGADAAGTADEAGTADAAAEAAEVPGVELAGDDGNSTPDAWAGEPGPAADAGGEAAVDATAARDAARSEPGPDGGTDGDALPEACLPGATRCDAATVQRCDADGRTWVAARSCADTGQACRDGECAGTRGGGCSAGPRGVPAAPAGAAMLLWVLAGLAAMRGREREGCR